MMLMMENSKPSNGLLPSQSQPLVALIIAACLVGVAAWGIASGGFSGGLVHHDAPPATTIRFSVNINAAPEIELSQLPGLGPAMARRIVDYRQEHGPFPTIESLLDVPGIGAVTLQQIRPHVRPIRVPKPASSVDPAGPPQPAKIL